jgi:hypothetical protein
MRTAKEDGSELFKPFIYHKLKKRLCNYHEALRKFRKEKDEIRILEEVV